MSIPAFIMIDGAIIVVVWKLWKWVERWQLAMWAVLMMMLGVSIWATDTQSPSLATPPWLATLLQFGVYFLIPAMAMVVATRLIQWDPPSIKPVDWRLVITRWLAVVGLLLLVGYQVMLSSIWDVATDGLRGPALLLLVDFTTLAAALILVWTLPGRRKLAALAFAVAVLLLMGGAHRLGTYDPDGKWGKLATLVTEQRAEAINHALQRFRAQNGRYPSGLTDLTPRYLVYIPNPTIIPGQTWCYDGGSDYYRFGYVYRASFSSPASVRIHAAVGNPPDAAWACP